MTFLAFQEITFKATKIIVDEQRKKDERKGVKFGVEKRWEPPKKSMEEVEKLEKENPFA